ncbi:MAG: Hpt domain-containing protein [Candidatus Omnitrophica bacterium]|nr:Hpt domain-containing protein [Candidatus Omnitrophota bacterium]
MITNSEQKILVRVEGELKPLVPGYLEHRLNDIRLIRDALDRKNFEVIQQLAHILKGSGGGYGFDFISEIGDRMEVQAKSQDTNGVAQCVNELTHYLKRLEIVYEF